MKFKSKSGDSINLNRDDLREVANKVFNENASLDKLVQELIGDKLDNCNSKQILEDRVKYYIKTLKPTKTCKLVITIENLPENYAHLIREDIETDKYLNGHEIGKMKVKVY